MLDVTVPSQRQSAVAAAVGAFGRLDLLVHNAGVCGDFHPTGAAPERLWEEVFRTNVFGAVQVGVEKGCMRMDLKMDRPLTSVRRSTNIRAHA